MSGPNFTFSTNVPQAGQKISATQVPILNNFQATSEWLNVDHIGFSDNINYGKHDLTTLQQMPGNVDPSTLSTEMSVYCKSVTGDVNGYELFARYPSNGTIIQLTGSPGSGLPGSSSYAYINSGLLFKWGTFSITTTAPTTFTLPTGGGIPAYTTSVFFVQLVNPVATIGETPIVPFNITTTSFQTKGYSPSAAVSYKISWFALGI